MSAVADPPLDTLVSQPRREVAFAARRESLVLVHTAEYPHRDAEGRKTGEMKPGTRIKFNLGMLRVPEEGDIVTEQGRKFPAATLLEWMRDHRLNGDYDAGFWEIPQAAPPVSEVELERVTQALIIHDTDALGAILEAEVKGWDRAMLTGPVRRAIEQIGEFQAQMAAQQEAEAAEAAKPKPKPAAK